MLNGLSNAKDSQNKVLLKEERIKTKKLSNDLRRKDKALAEASALIILKKKAEDYFSELEDY